ncbi:hypothetical protein F5X97DRAFT_292778, partial [Nemania serpens]
MYRFLLSCSLGLVLIIVANGWSLSDGNRQVASVLANVLDLVSPLFLIFTLPTLVFSYRN